MTARIDRIWPDPAENLSDDEILSRRDSGLRVNFVSSVDGAATSDGLSGGLSSAADKRLFELLRRTSDVVVVGAGTVRAEGYGGLRVSPASVQWRVAHGMAEHPVFAIVSGGLDLEPDSPIFTDAPVQPIIVTTTQAEGADRFDGRATVIAAGSGKHIDVKSMLTSLHDRDLTSILCEGGPSLFGSLLQADVVDELFLTLAPSLEAGEAPRIANGATPPREMQLGQVLKSGNTLLLRYIR